MQKSLPSGTLLSAPNSLSGPGSGKGAEELSRACQGSAVSHRPASGRPAGGRSRPGGWRAASPWGSPCLGCFKLPGSSSLSTAWGRGLFSKGPFPWRSLQPHQGLCRLWGWEVGEPPPGTGLGLTVEVEARLSLRSAGLWQPANPFPFSLRKPQPGAWVSQAREAHALGTQGTGVIAGVLGSSAGAQSPGPETQGRLDPPEAGTLGVSHLGGA